MSTKLWRIVAFLSGVLPLRLLILSLTAGDFERLVGPLVLCAGFGGLAARKLGRRPFMWGVAGLAFFAFPFVVLAFLPLREAESKHGRTPKPASRHGVLGLDDRETGSIVANANPSAVQPAAKGGGRPVLFGAVSLGVGFGLAIFIYMMMTWQLQDESSRLRRIDDQVVWEAERANRVLFNSWLVSCALLVVCLTALALILHQFRVSQSAFSLALLVAWFALLTQTAPFIESTYRKVLANPPSPEAFALLPCSSAGTADAPFMLYLRFLAFASLYGVSLGLASRERLFKNG